MPRQKENAQQGETTLWLLSLIEDYLTLNEMDNDGNTFGRLAAKDHTIVTRLRDGGDISVTKMDAILAFMQRPVESYRMSATTGSRDLKILKPLTIKPRSLP